MTQSPIRVGIVGAGANTQRRHIPRLREIEGVQVVGVVNRSRESSERVASAFQIPRIYEDWRQLLDDSEIDAVVIGTWPYMHCPVTLAALEAGRHVLCEARMAMNATEARQMRDAARARPHLAAQVVPSPLTLRFDTTIKRLIREGYLGDILAIDLRTGGGFIDRDAPLHWRHDLRYSGKNILSMGIWYEALLRWVGDARRVTAMGRTFVRRRLDEQGRLHWIAIPDHLDILCEMVCGAQANLQFSAVAGLDARDAVTLYGSEGTLRLAGGRLLGGRRGDAELAEIEIPAEEQGHWRVEEEFAAAVRGEGEVRLTTFDDGLRYMLFTEAVHASLATGTAVAVELASS